MISGIICAVVIGAGFPGLESRADYTMDVRLEPDSSMIFGHSEILFTNGVDFPVDTLWLHLYRTLSIFQFSSENLLRMKNSRQIRWQR